MKTQKRLAAQIMKCGVNRVRVNLEDEEVTAAITREDVRQAIARGAIYKLPVKGTSKVRTRKKKRARRQGRSRGHGNRKGTKTARTPKKKRWMKQVRAIRRKLRDLRGSGEIDKKTYRRHYRNANAGLYRSKAHAEAMARKGAAARKG